MDVPILLLWHAVVAHAHNLALALANDADQALQVEGGIITAETDASHLNREIGFGYGGLMALPVHHVRDNERVVALPITGHFPSRMRQRLTQAVFLSAAPSFLG